MFLVWPEFKVTDCLAVPALQAKWKTCLVELESTKKAFDDLSAALSNDAQQKWEEEERTALSEGGEALSVYGVRLEEGNWSTLGFYLF